MKNSNKLLRHITIGAVLALLAGRAWSQKPQIVGQERPATDQDWEQRIALAEERLRAGDFKKTQNISEGLVLEMLHTIESGPGAGPILGETLLLRALGLAGHDKTRDALWDWHAARVLDPKLTNADLPAYGEVGEALLRAVEKEERSNGSDRVTRAGINPESGERVNRPVKVKGEPPGYPHALKTACLQGVVVLESIVDREGYVVSPALTSSPSPILTLATMEALRTWRFKPAVFRKKPVPVYYTMTMNFQIKTCRNPAAVAEHAERKD